jgi:hypothetical protein
MDEYDDEIELGHILPLCVCVVPLVIWSVCPSRVLNREHDHGDSESLFSHLGSTGRHMLDLSRRCE